MSEAGHRLVFVGGLHRSGTTPFARVLAGHPSVSGLSDTGVREDEGQHLQDVYPSAKQWGGSGHFARDPRAHLLETSALATPDSADRLMAQWSPYWDLSRPVLVEKSPPNVIMGRFLQQLFPEASFVMVVRHPVTVALSTRKWTGLISRRHQLATLSQLVEHWLVAHRLLLEDLPHLRRVHVVHYEQLVSRPQDTLAAVQAFLQLPGEIPAAQVKGGHSQGYQQTWDAYASRRRPGGWQRRLIERRYATEIARYGYRLDDLSRYADSPSGLLR